MAGSMSQCGGSFGLGLPNLSSNRPVSRTEMGTSKMLPFMNNHSSSNPNHPNSASGNFGPRHLYDPPSLGLGMSGLGIGINNDGMSANPMGYLTAQNGSINHMSANKPPSKFFGC